MFQPKEKLLTLDSILDNVSTIEQNVSKKTVEEVKAKTLAEKLELKLKHKTFAGDEILWL